MNCLIFYEWICVECPGGGFFNKLLGFRHCRDGKQLREQFIDSFL
jgi:hypothetical protein